VNISQLKTIQAMREYVCRHCRYRRTRDPARRTSADGVGWAASTNSTESGSLGAIVLAIRAKG